MLKELMLDSSRRARVVSDCVQLVDDEVGSKSGLSGLAVKGAYTVVTKVKPGFVREAVDHLIDDFVSRLEPFYAEWDEKRQGTFEAFLSGRASAVANALLGVTDDKAKRVKNPTIKKAYEKLRPTAEKHVEAAVPGVGRVVQKHVGEGRARSA